MIIDEATPSLAEEPDVDMRHGGDYPDVDDFVLDSNIDIVPSTPDLTIDEGSSVVDFVAALRPSHLVEHELMEEANDVDDFAEVEAWLNSGAVEIIP